MKRLQDSLDDKDKGIVFDLKDWLPMDVISLININWSMLELKDDWNKGRISLIIILNRVLLFENDVCFKIISSNEYIVDYNGDINNLIKLACDYIGKWESEYEHKYLDYEDEKVSYHAEYGSYSIVMSSIFREPINKELKQLEEEGMEDVYFEQLVL